MRTFLLVVLWAFAFSNGQAQEADIDWYSVSENRGLTIQNSYPKGGPYPGLATGYFNPSYLVFFTRIVNHTGRTIEIDLHASAEAVGIPHSPHTYVKLLLPSDTMTLDKVRQFSYGISKLSSLEGPGRCIRSIAPGEECMIYFVGFFYQTEAAAWEEDRGGNRAELILEGSDLYYHMPPQINRLWCGKVAFLE